MVLAEKIKIEQFNSLRRDEGCFYVTLKPLLSLINKQYTENAYVDNVRSNIFFVLDFNSHHLLNYLLRGQIQMKI